MIDSEGIYKKVDNLIDKYGTRDPLILAPQLGIEVNYVDYFNSLLGMYVYRWRHRAIFLNDGMDEYLTKMVCGHEIGHDFFHRDLAGEEGLKEFQLFRMQSPTELEANIFNAHLLLDTNECIELARNGYDVWHIASEMNSEMNLVLIKLQELSRLGYNLRLPMEPQSDFFKNLKA